MCPVLRQCRPFLAAALFLVPATAAQQAPPQFVVRAPLFNAVAGEVSGEKALSNVRGITQFHRVQASPGFSQAREWVVERLKAAGITDVEVEKFPSDGRTRYSTHVSPMAWTVREGELRVESPFQETLCKFTNQAVCLSTLSNGGNWRGGAIDVGKGTAAAHYDGKEVRGKIVFASGYAGAVHREAVIQRGALGVVIYPEPDDRPEHPDLVRYNGLWIQGDEKDKATFGFQISPRQWARLKPLVQTRKIVLSAKVDAELHPGALEVTSAFLRGSDASREIILVSHLDHYRPGANDNASGSATNLEIARALKTLLEQKKIPPLKYTLHFLWVPEHFGTVAWLSKHPEISQRAIAVLNLDMTGENIYKTNSILRITRTPDSLPSFLNDLVEDVAKQVEAANLTSTEGSRNLFHWRMTPYDPGSDHDQFNDSNVRVPALMLGHWPDWTHHTNEDSVDKVDSTTLRRLGVLAATASVWLATAEDAELMELASVTAGSAFSSLFGREGGPFASMGRSMSMVNRPGSMSDEAMKDFQRQSAHSVSGLGVRAEQAQRAVKSIEPLLSEKSRGILVMMGGTFDMMRNMMGAMPRMGLPEPTASMKRIPKHTFIGPIADGPSSLWFRQTLGADYAWWQEQQGKIKKFDVLVYEACNFADGKRTIVEIEDAIAAEFGDVPEGLIEGIFDRLVKAGLAEFVEKKN